MNSNEVIASAGRKHNLLVFSLNEYKGVRSFDMRKHYVDKKTNDLRPTKKGIAITEKMFDITLDVLEENKEKIRNWLSISGDISAEVRENLELEKKYSEAARFKNHKFNLEESSWKSPEFFRLVSKGGCDSLVFNISHPSVKEFLKIINTFENTSDIEELQQLGNKLKWFVIGTLISFGRARHLCEGSDNSYTSIVFDSMAFNWGTFLEQYLNGEKEEKE